MTKSKAETLAETLEDRLMGGHLTKWNYLDAAAHLREQDALIGELVEALTFTNTGKGKLHTKEDVDQLLAKAEAAR